MSDQLWELMQETQAVRQLAETLRTTDRTGTTTPDQEREYLLRRAALDQRHRAYDPQDMAGAAEAQQSAVMLRDHDAVHGTHQGPVPASAARWISLDGAARYVRQEVAAGLSGEVQ
ncbi:hypothetical protein [Streptomyces syringium]|uniref:hypothetical protein n=1 Tax=Streptomyces syringium TaxID=76729 RepID=UPI0037D7ED65